jgi:hypothetical protein
MQNIVDNLVGEENLTKALNGATIEEVREDISQVNSFNTQNFSQALPDLTTQTQSRTSPIALPDSTVI